jgi:hypothetical protein
MRSSANASFRRRFAGLWTAARRHRPGNFENRLVPSKPLERIGPYFKFGLCRVKIAGQFRLHFDEFSQAPTCAALERSCLRGHWNSPAGTTDLTSCPGAAAVARQVASPVAVSGSKS